MTWLTPVTHVIWSEDLDDMPAIIEDQTAEMDDAYWRVFVVKTFTWLRFWNWWVARRWVEPRDIRKR